MKKLNISLKNRTHFFKLDLFLYENKPISLQQIKNELKFNVIKMKKNDLKIKKRLEGSVMRASVKHFVPEVGFIDMEPRAFISDDKSIQGFRIVENVWVSDLEDLYPGNVLNFWGKKSMACAYIYWREETDSVNISIQTKRDIDVPFHITYDTAKISLEEMIEDIKHQIVEFNKEYKGKAIRLFCE